MKKSLFFLVLLFNCILLANELDEIDKIVSKINSKRAGKLPKDKILNVPSPMPKLVVEANSSKSSNDKNITVIKPKEEEFVLTAIMNNSAFINGKWVKLGERINGYKLVDIMDNSIFLRNGKRTKLVFFKPSKKIKITIGR